MSSPIVLCEFSEDEYRRFIKTLSDEELIKAGEAAPHVVRRCNTDDAERVPEAA